MCQKRVRCIQLRTQHTYVCTHSDGEECSEKVWLGDMYCWFINTLFGKLSMDMFSDGKGTPVTGHIVGERDIVFASDGIGKHFTCAAALYFGIVWYCAEEHAKG